MSEDAEPADRRRPEEPSDERRQPSREDDVPTPADCPCPCHQGVAVHPVACWCTSRADRPGQPAPYN